MVIIKEISQSVLENSDINMQYVLKYYFDDMDNALVGRSDVEKIMDIVSKFSKWEERCVYSLPDGYESFRDLPNGGFDYDEVLEMYVDTIFCRFDRWIVMKEPRIRWDDNYSRFLTFIFPKLDNEGFNEFNKRRRKL